MIYYLKAIWVFVYYIVIINILNYYIYIIVLFPKVKTICTLWWYQTVGQTLEVSIILQGSNEYSKEVQVASTYEGPEDDQSCRDRDGLNCAPSPGSYSKHFRI